MTLRFLSVTSRADSRATGVGSPSIEGRSALQDGDIKKALIDATNEAVERGVFGAPTLCVDGELHFGQDRLPWVEEALAR